jgi:hypothetical protein
MREEGGMEGKGEAWEGTRGGTKGREEKRMRGREELGRPETRGNRKCSSDFYRGKFALLPEGMNAPCCPDVIRFVYEEFKVDEVRKV